jgi:anti-sigma factor RsiW
MIEDTIQQIEARLTSAENLPPEKRAELSELLAALKREVADLARTHAEEAQSIAGFAQVSAHEATRAEVQPELLQYSLRGLSRSVEGFEESHPRLVQAVNSICTTLSNLGI